MTYDIWILYFLLNEDKYVTYVYWELHQIETAWKEWR